MMLLYRLLYFILLPFFLFFGLIFSRKVRRFILERESNLKKQTNKTFWMHVSSGEFEHAKPVLRELKQIEPNTKIVISYSSPSYLKSIKACKEVDYYTPYPLDLKAPVSQLVKTINPKVALISKTDLWPEMLDLLKRKNIPSMVFARHESGNGKFIKKISYPITYQKLSHISFISSEDVENYKTIATPKSFSIDGDPRIEEVFYKKNQMGTPKDTIEKSLILGSVWPEDIKVIKEPILELLKSEDIKKLIIAPHEPEEEFILKLEKAFSEFEPSRYSKDEDLSSKVVIVDKIGHLFELYSHCEVSFVGGSFKKKVHAVLEPLSFGLPVLVGPNHTNNHDAKRFQKEGFVISCENQKEFKEELSSLLIKRPNRSDIISGLLPTEQGRPSPAQAVLHHLHKFDLHF